MKMKLSTYVIFYIFISAIVLGITNLGSRAVTVMAERNAAFLSPTIVIDPGHGGVDGGATSCTGVLESGLNLEIAQRLNDLCQLIGYKTLMTRTTDTSIHVRGDTIASQKMSDLKERVRLVSETDNAILISIHQNTFSDDRYSGAQVFYNSNPDSKLLADDLQQKFIYTINPNSKRRAKKAENIYLMEHCHCPAVLIECGFLSNTEEESKLRNTVYQKQLCSVIAAVLQNFMANA